MSKIETKNESPELVDGYTPIYRFSPTPEQFGITAEGAMIQDMADEYAVCADKRANAGIIVYAKHNGVWRPNPYSTRFLIRHLLKELSIYKNAKHGSRNS